MAIDYTQKDGTTKEVVIRVTDVFRKIGGKWLIVQEHVSFPVEGYYPNRFDGCLHTKLRHGKPGQLYVLVRKHCFIHCKHHLGSAE